MSGRSFCLFLILLAHDEVERHGNQEAAEAEENLVEVGLDEQPDADKNGDNADSGQRCKVAGFPPLTG